jgi:hypothetical protein
MQPSESTEGKKSLLLLESDDEIRDLKRAPHLIKSIQLFENEIQIKISYTGGCKTHDFQLVVGRNSISKLTKDINLNLSHNDNDDRCKRIVNEKLAFDLSPLLQLIYPQDLKYDVKLFIDGRPVEKFKPGSNSV